MTSVIQVVFQDKLAAVAHVIGADQLPMKSQISRPGIAFLNPSAGERAILVKTGHCDSMIVAGKWFGFLRRKEGKNGTQSTPGNPGHLKVKVNRVVSKMLPKEEIIHLSQYHPVQYKGLTLDFNKCV